MDRINEDKRELNNKLLAKLKFVRDLQAAVGTAHNGDITDFFDKNMEQ